MQSLLSSYQNTSFAPTASAPPLSQSTNGLTSFLKSNLSFGSSTPSFGSSPTSSLLDPGSTLGPFSAESSTKLKVSSWILLIISLLFSIIFA